MKRQLTWLLLTALLLSGCGKINPTVQFYYVSKNYQSTLTDVIVSEKRDASGHENDLSYLLTLYLMGPADKSLQSLLPLGASFQCKENTDGSLDIILADTAKVLTDTDFSLACACLTLTCLDITNAAEVNITSGNRSVTMDRDNLTLFDTLTETTPTEDQK